MIVENVEKNQINRFNRKKIRFNQKIRFILKNLNFFPTLHVLRFVSRKCYVLSEDEDDHVCVRGTKALLWFDDWKKGLLYIIVASGCFIRPHQLWLAAITGKWFRLIRRYHYAVRASFSNLVAYNYYYFSKSC